MTPSPKSQALIALVSFIYGPARKELETRLNHIVWRFKQTHPQSIGAFMYKGNIFAEPGYRPIGRVPMLRGELVAPLEQVLKEKTLLQYEIDLGTSVLSCAITQASSKATLLQLLPDSLHGALSQIPDFENQPCSPKTWGTDQETAFADIKKRLLLNMIT